MWPLERRRNFFLLHADAESQPLCAGAEWNLRDRVLGGSIQIDLLLWQVSQVALVVKNLPLSAGDIRDGFSPWVGKIPLRRKWQPTPVSLPRESPWTEELSGLLPWGHKESEAA